MALLNSGVSISSTQEENNGAKNSVSVKAEPVGVAVFPLISV